LDKKSGGRGAGLAPSQDKTITRKEEFRGRSNREQKKLMFILKTVHSLTKYETPLQTSPRNGERL
jgi:hypothetical protein